MSTADSFITKSIIAKSDQLNACDLIRPIVVTVQEVTPGPADQPVIVKIDGGRQPYKPCKTARRILVSCWGDNPSDWIGKKMKLFNDPKVVWAGEAVGGIRISHVSGISEKKTIQLNVSRGKKGVIEVLPLESDLAKRVEAFIGAVNKAATSDEIDGLLKRGEQLLQEADEASLQKIDLTVSAKRESLKDAANE
jgi:hypothetical protein